MEFMVVGDFHAMLSNLMPHFCKELMNFMSTWKSQQFKMNEICEREVKDKTD